MSEPLDLTNSGLRIPAFQPEPLPITRVTPSPCTQACPAGINVKAYVSLIAEGRHREALDTIRKRCPLPAICGRICHHPCEKACRRGRYDDAVAIRSLKRFVADHERDYVPASPPPITQKEKIAIIGSGPAGLTAAYDLRWAGYTVTVFEAEKEAGGMLRYGIADYRLPADVLDFEIDVLRRAGVEIVCGQRVGGNLELDELPYRGYSATLLAVGAQLGRNLGLEGERATPEVEDALSFLRRVKNGDRTRVDGRIVVIGGGSTAVEAARTALRLGAWSVEILYRRYREELLADHEEVEAAESEGIHFRFLVAPRRLVKENGKLTGIECRQVGLGEPDAGGRRRPIEIPGSELVVPAERILAAIGQKTDFTFLTSDIVERVAGRGKLIVTESNLMTPIAGIFAAGDAVTGPATVVEAIGAGHRAAESIRHFLQEGRAEVREQKPERRAPIEYELPDPQPLAAARVHPELLHIDDAAPFAEVERVFSEDEAIAEAGRCLRCGPCGECRTCAPTCNRRHIMVRSGDDAFLLRTTGGVALALTTERATPAELLSGMRNRSVHLDTGAHPAEVLPVRSRIEGTRCRTCGRCVDVCPFHALTIDGSSARLNAALCRGCGLCSAVCPTSTAVQSALSPEWWTDRLDHVRADHAPYVVLACQRRAGSLEKTFDENGFRVDVIRFRCVGQIDAGMLLELRRRPFRGILVAGCVEERCRFTNGARRASEQLERAHAIARAAGIDTAAIVADWSPDRLHDPLAQSIASLIGGH